MQKEQPEQSFFFSVFGSPSRIFSFTQYLLDNASLSEMEGFGLDFLSSEEGKLHRD